MCMIMRFGTWRAQGSRKVSVSYQHCMLFCIYLTSLIICKRRNVYFEFYESPTVCFQSYVSLMCF